MQKHGKNIPNQLLEAIVYAYCENNNTNFSSVDEMQVFITMNKQEDTDLRSSVDIIKDIDLSKTPKPPYINYSY